MEFLTLWTSAILFALVAVLHLARLIWNTDLIIGGWSAPKWVSFLAIVIPGLLAFGLFRIILNQ